MRTARLEHGAERRGFVLERRRAGIGPGVAQARPWGVVADDRPLLAELLDERAEARVAPVQLEVSHPPAAEEERRPFPAARPGDRAPVVLREADLLLLHRPSLNRGDGRSGPCEMAG